MSLDEIQENKCVQKLKDQQHGVSMCDMKFYLNRAKLASAMDNLTRRGIVIDEVKRDMDRTKRKNRKRGNDEALQKIATKKVETLLGLASKTLVLDKKWKSYFSFTGYMQYIRECVSELQERYVFFLVHGDFNLASPRRKTPSILVLAKVIDIVAQLKKDKVAKANLEEAKRTLMEVARSKSFDSKWRSAMHSPLQSEKVSYGSKSQTYAEVLHLVLTKERHDHTNNSAAFNSAVREASARSFGGDILDGVGTLNRVLVLDFMGDMIGTPRGTTFRDWVADFYGRIVWYRKKTRAKIVICILDTAQYDSILRLLVERYRKKQQNHDSSVEFDFDIDDDVSELHKSYKECHHNYKTSFRPMLSRMFREGMKDLAKFPLILIGGHHEKGTSDVQNICNVGNRLDMCGISWTTLVCRRIFANAVRHAEAERVACRVCIEIAKRATSSVTLLVHSPDSDWGASHAIVAWKEMSRLQEQNKKLHGDVTFGLVSLYFNKSRGMLKHFKTSDLVYTKVNIAVDVKLMCSTLERNLPFGTMDIAVGFIAICCDLVPKFVKYSSKDWLKALCCKELRKHPLFDKKSRVVNPLGIMELYHVCTYLKLKSKIVGMKFQDVDLQRMIAFDYTYGNRFRVLDPIELILRTALVMEVGEVMVDSLFKDAAPDYSERTVPKRRSYDVSYDNEVPISIDREYHSMLLKFSQPCGERSVRSTVQSLFPKRLLDIKVQEVPFLKPFILSVGNYSTLRAFLQCVLEKHRGMCPHFTIKFNVLENSEFLSVDAVKFFLENYIEVSDMTNPNSSHSKKRFDYERQRVNSTIKTYGQYTNSPMKFFRVKRVSQGQGCIFDPMIIPDDLYYDDDVTYDQLLLSLRNSSHRKDACKLILLLVEHLIKHSSKKDADESMADFENDEDRSDDDSMTDDETELVSEEVDDDVVSNLEVDDDIVGVSGDGDDTIGDSAATPASRMDVDTPAVGNKRSLRPLGTNKGTANTKSANPRSRKEQKLDYRRDEGKNLSRRFNIAAEE
jgi:hypothetical protein